ncbi:MAG: hypothetical protein DIJKHBIC_01158 [Thermoanaerobaculia bacterium]|nr:hypothetical protein [Thermoanaerobaculia bacterium]
MIPVDPRWTEASAAPGRGNAPAIRGYADRAVLQGERLGANAGAEIADAVGLDAVVEDGDGDVRVRVAEVAVDEGVDRDLALGLRGHGQPVLAVDCALREAS